MKTMLSLLLLFVAVASAWASVSVDLLPQANVGASTVTVGDVATVTGDAPEAVRAVVLGPAPAPGATRPLRRDQVAWRLAQEGVKGFRMAGAPVVNITRATRQVTAAELDQAAQDCLRRECGEAGPLLELQPASPIQPLTVPAGVLEIQARALRAALGSLRSVALTVLVDGQVVRAPTVCYRARLELEVPVLVATGYARTELSPALWTLQRVDVAGVSGRPLRAEEMGDRRLRRTVTAGTVLTTDNTEPIPQVLKGMPVLVTVRGGALSLTVEAVARADAALGQAVELENPSSKQTFTAIVTGPSRAEIRY